jgi:hypothetical protein
VHRIWLKPLSLLAVVAMVAVACGDDDDDDTVAATTAATGATTAAGATTTASGGTEASTAATTAGSTTETTGAAESENPLEDERLAFVPQNYPGIDGSYTGVGTGAPVGDTEGLSDIRAALDAAGFTTTPISTYGLTGWNSADMLVEMIENAPGPLTTESITNFANKGWAYPGYGEAVCPMYWPLGHYTSTPCWHIVQLDLTGANGATNSVGANGGKGGLLPKVTRTYVDLFITDKPS